MLTKDKLSELQKILNEASYKMEMERLKTDPKYLNYYFKKYVENKVNNNNNQLK